MDVNSRRCLKVILLLFGFLSFFSLHHAQTPIPPKILSSSPQSFHQPLGTTARIYCRAEGSPKPQASWTKDGKTLRISSRVTIQNEGTEVIINNLQKQDGGIYKCTFRNAVGLISQTVHLIVEGQAYIIGAPSNKTAVLGQRIQFTCQARGYPANITYRWYKDDYAVNLLPGYGSRIIIQGDGSLVITIVEKEDMGWYQCRPSNGVGTDPEAVAFLNVTYAPIVLIDQMPTRVIWALRFKEKLGCPVDANPPTYNTMWTKNGALISHQTDPRLSLQTNGTLVVENVLMIDSGAYRCTAISTFGTGDSQPVQVEVKDPPRFTVLPEPTYLRMLGESVSIQCGASGTPEPTITWRKVGVNLLFGGRIQVNSGTLTINSLIKSDHGIYECEASNEVRKIITSTEIIIQNTTPYPPYNVSVETKWFSATIRWIPAYSSSPQFFTVGYRSVVNNIPSDWTTLQVKSQGVTRYSVYGLQPDTVYEFRVLARNDLGSGQYSNTVQAKTLGYADGVPEVPPTDSTNSTYFPPIIRPIGERPTTPVNVSALLKGNNIEVTWNAPLTSPVTIYNYVVEYKIGDDDWIKSQYIKAPTRSFLFTDVREGERHSFRVYSYGLMAFSYPTNAVNVDIAKDDDVGLSGAQIGGIVGGVLFLIVAIALAVVGIMCNHRRDGQKQQNDKYGNVKYMGPQDDMDGRPEYSPEWSDGPPPSAPPGGGRNTIKHDPRALVGTDNGIFMVPKSGDMYTSYTSHDHSVYRDRDRLLFAPETARGAAYHVDNSSNYFDNMNYQNTVLNVTDRNSTMNRSGRSLPVGDDDNGFRDSVRLRHGSSAKNRSRSQPVYRHSDGPRYPTPERPRSRGHSLPREHSRQQSFYDDTIPYGPQGQVLPRSPQHPTSQTPVLSPVIQSHSRLPDYHGDEDVFMAPSKSLSSVVPSRPGFPRHSSMKPGAQQTYLTQDMDHSGQPFMTSDISSVLPSPFSDAQKPYHPYQNQYPEQSVQSVPYVNQSRYADQSRDGSFGDMENTVVARKHESPERTMSRTRMTSAEDSSESSGRPVSYTRDQLLGAVDQVRRGARGQGYGQQWGSGTDFSSESPTFIGHGAQIPESAKPSVIVRDRPSRGLSYDQDPSHRQSNGQSMNSSGTGSYLGRSRGMVGQDHSRNAGREDLTPDSISSGIGSRNTSSQLTGSSLHSRPSRLGSSLVPENDNSHELTDYPHPQRKDISADENYEFDSYNAVESDLLEALRNYSEVNTGNEELLNALQEGLSTSGLMSELYPKPTRQSRYSDSEQRFEKLRGEYHKYRQQQQDGSRFEYDPRSPRDYQPYQPQSDSYSSTVSSRQATGNTYGRPDMGQYYVKGNGSGYKAGPMDSDML